MLPKRRKPTHPGIILHEDFLKPLGMTARQFAEKLGGSWTEMQIEAMIKGKESVSDKACKAFSAVLGTAPHFWHHLQSVYTQWESIHRQNEKGSIKTWKKAQ